MLDDGGVGHADGCEHEADGDTHDGTELDAHAAEDGVENTIQEWSEDQDGDGVEVLHEIVRHAVTDHLSSLRDEVGRELTVADPEDWVYKQIC